MGSSPKKKSVSWSDSADLALKLRLSGHFMDLLWLHIAKHLLQFAHELNWRRTLDEEKVNISRVYDVRIQLVIERHVGIEMTIVFKKR